LIYLRVFFLQLVMIQSNTYSLTILALASLPLLAQAESTQTLPTLYVDAQQTANIRPVTTYESPVSNLEFEPRIDLQSRNMAEAQGDVTIRGGIFEGTGFRIGSATLIDPQTGHYSTELPIAPEMLTLPEILTGSENALFGFNSTAGTISYGWSQIQDGGKLTIGGGDHDLNFQRIHHGITGALGESGVWSWGLEAEMSRSESAGSIQNGDHDFNRSSGRLQILGPKSQTDFFAGYQGKKFAWPGMYTGTKYINALEYEDIRTNLFIINHHEFYGDDNYFEITATHRQNRDNYQLDAIKLVIDDPETLAVDESIGGTATALVDYPALHNTKVSSLAINGFHKMGASFGFHYTGQITADEWKKVDPYTDPQVDATRTYVKLSILPEYLIALNSSDSLTFRIGGSVDDTNRDESQLSAIGDIKWRHVYSNGNSDNFYLSYSEASQVAGYVATGDYKGGPYGSNADLSRETSHNIEVGGAFKRGNYTLAGTLFHRWDNELIDWTYSNNVTTARSAKGIDIETFGVELIASKHWNTIEAIASYTHLNKDEDYGNDSIDASFYALNYAKHRFTLGAIWTPSEIIQFRIDNEWRQNQENSLRLGSDSALFTHIGLSIYPPQLKNMELFFAVDNAWDDDFEDVPGTPGRGDQYSAGVTFSW